MYLSCLCLGSFYLACSGKNDIDFVLFLCTFTSTKLANTCRIHNIILLCVYTVHSCIYLIGVAWSSALSENSIVFLQQSIWMKIVTNNSNIVCLRTSQKVVGRFSLISIAITYHILPKIYLLFFLYSIQCCRLLLETIESILTSHRFKI